MKVLTQRKSVTPKAVIFDMDGLLIDSEQVYFKSFKQTSSIFNVTNCDDIFFKILGQNHVGTLKILSTEFGCSDFSRQFEKQWSLEAHKLFQHPIDIKPGVHDLLIALDRQRIPYAVATGNMTETAMLLLQKCGLGSVFSIIIGGDQVENGKPEPDIYLKAAEALHIRPGHCAVFEDSENGVRAGLAAGMSVFQVPDMVEPTDEFRNLGHTILDSLRAGPMALGLEAKNR
ncbi:putative Haloacid dehalogenase-like hydrolase [Shewanella benthica]|uniref:Putative Haloacid dehalogenase-like hydrolase n=1 Tax=Shewanella benthica TaxID=43661 RepID=A0A330LXB7_9GAMM|nr:HAD family phosphatase [Shewanella benthica]SQH74104.1 putative Haloacid dehalogenase-like hydrolase [Shewanella benthica]